MQKSIPPSPNLSADSYAALDKGTLHLLAERLLLDEPSAITTCIAFIEAETNGIWHGRARAMMCRRLKHCSLSPSQRTRLVSCITQRLCSGRFSEQFRDQMRLALHIDPESVFIAARSCADDPRDYVRRYAAWVLAHAPYSAEKDNN